VPVAIRAFLESEDYEDAVRQAISVGGDNDTIACMTGGIAQAFYGGVPR
jgi:ADP-ribosylglycohydrolase